MAEPNYFFLYSIWDIYVMTVLVYFVTFTYLLFALVIHVVSAQRKRKNKTENEKRDKAKF